MTGTTLRRAGADDAAALARIHLDARRSAGSAFPPAVHPDDEYLPHLLHDVIPGHEVWLAELAGRPAGMLVLAGERLLDGLYVHPDEQHRGVGSTLVDHAKDARPDGLDLWVFATNLPARRLYTRHGFVVVAGTSGDNEEGAPDLLMRWPAP